MEKNTFDAAWIPTLPAQVQTFLNGRNTKGDVYAYDWAYRLVDARYDVTNPLQEVQNPGSQPFVKDVAYTLDGLGNRSQVLTTPPTPPSTVTYAADVVNQYTAVGGVARTHDNNGNLKDDGTWVFSYDFENRLVQVRQSGTLTLIADYHYDALGRRVEKVLAAGTTTRYLLDGVEVVEEYDAVGNWQARYVYEDGIDRPRCMDRADIADVNGNQNTTEVLRFHYHQQALGSVTEVTQPTGAVVEWVTYDVYGLPTIRDQQGNGIVQSAIGNPYLYTGREYDSEDGLYFYRARNYDPRTGRFLQRDPAGCLDSFSGYEYAGSRPAAFIDPMGERITLRGEDARGRDSSSDLDKAIGTFISLAEAAGVEAHVEKSEDGHEATVTSLKKKGGGHGESEMLARALLAIFEDSGGAESTENDVEILFRQDTLVESRGGVLVVVTGRLNANDATWMPGWAQVCTDDDSPGQLFWSLTHELIHQWIYFLNLPEATKEAEREIQDEYDAEGKNLLDEPENYHDKVKIAAKAKAHAKAKYEILIMIMTNGVRLQLGIPWRTLDHSKKTPEGAFQLPRILIY